MIVWRLARAVYPALDGEGARRHGGRWNAPEMPVAYASERLSLSVLEALVHTDPDLLPDDLTAYRIDVPDDLSVPALDAFDARALPADWRDLEVSVRLGEAWAALGSEALLVVPSFVVPQERSVLVNPKQPDASRIRVVGSEPFAFGSRLLAR